MTDHVYALSPGKMLAEYRIERVLGAGGFGITYYAWDTNLDKPVAIKEYMPGDFAVRVNAGMVQAKSSGAAANFRKFLKDFLQEARVLARFEHPHVNKVHRYFEANGTAYMVLEYMDGETLSDMLRREGQLAPKFLRRLMGELLSALEAVHAARYVHRDVKPANIMLRGDGSVVLLDFGIARRVIGQTNITVALTRVYAPIEQYEQDAKKVGAWTDLYALGMVAYRCVSGIAERELPDAVTRGNWKRRGEVGNLRPAVEVGAGKYDEGFLKAIDHAIEVYENERPQSVAEMRGELGVVAAFLSAESKQLGQKFLGRDFSPSAKDENGWTDLHYAAAGNWVEVVRFLLDEGADVDVRSSVRARRNDDESATKSILNTLNKIRHSTDIELHGGDLTPLHIAAQFGSYEVSRLLLENGANVETESRSGYMPLHAAVHGNAGNVVALLLKNGANIEAGLGSKTPLHLAAYHNDADKAAALLLKNGADIEAKCIGGYGKIGDTPLHVAAYCNAYKVAAVLLKNGADIEAKAAHGEPPLHLAVWANACNTAAVLLKNGADIEAKNADSSMPLHEAAWASRSGKKTYEMTELLLKNGADIEAMRSDDQTPLHVAAGAPGGFSSRVVAVLLKNGADVDAEAANGKTPLHMAAKGPEIKKTALLLKNGADIETKDGRGQTPLHVAVAVAPSYDDAVPAWLLKNGADIAAKDHDGKTPLHVAAAKDPFGEVVSLLLKNGADAGAKDAGGHTPLYEAARKCGGDKASASLSLLLKKSAVVKWSMPGAVLAAALDVVSHAMAECDVRKYLNGALLEVADGTMTVLATNGHRLAKCTLDAPAGVERARGIVPRDTVLRAVQWLADADDVDITLADGAIIMHKKETTFVSELIGDEFPEFKKIFEKEADIVISVDRLELLDVLSRTAVLVTSLDQGKGVQITLEEGTMRITVKNMEQEEAVEEISVQYTGKPVEAGYNVEYLIDALQAVKNNEIDFCMQTDDGVLFLRVPGDESMLFLIMPVRL